MEVSNSTVGPVGTAGGASCAVVLGASGRSLVEGVCADAVRVPRAAQQSRVRRVVVKIFIQWLG